MSQATKVHGTARRDVYAEVTASVLEQLEAGVVPWHKPWAGGQLPVSMSSGKSYRGINSFLLGLSGRESAWWGTYKQVDALGGQVRKGEKATLVVFWKRLVVATSSEERAAGRGDKKVVPMLKHFNVFSADQCDGLPAKFGAVSVVGGAFDPVDECERIVANYDGPTVAHGGSRAFYSPREDRVQLPNREAFESADSYYSTAFHELAHSTGHVSRLARKELLEFHHFGDASYSREELVAEMGAALLSGVAGISQRTVPQSAAYLASWLRVLRADSRLLVQAAGQAQKAADLILGVTFDSDEEG